ncbi:MAG: S1C family serine protease [Clostridia bacterium]|nr:S1C family serine protease [Clostridia bacterium]
MKKLSRFFKIFLIFMLATCCCTIFVSCVPLTTKPSYVISVTQDEELSTTAYIVLNVTYSDNSTEKITVRNGTDGTSSITPISFSDAWDFYCEFNDFEKTSENLHAFIDEFANFGAEALTINNIKKTAVCVYSEFNMDYTYSLFPIGTQTESCYNVGAGAGVIYRIDPDYTYVVTNFHVLFNNDKTTSYSDSLTYKGFANRIFVYQYGTNPKNFITNSTEKGLSGFYSGPYNFGGRAIECSYVGGTPYYDLAIIKLPTASTESWTKDVVKTTKYEEGDVVYAVGNPFGFGVSSTNGIISIASEHISFTGENYTHRVLRTSAAINGGNSGGGLFNAYGALVGIVNAKTNSSSVDNVGYAIPIDVVTKVVNNIMTNAGKRGLQTLNLTDTSIIDSYAKENASGVLETFETVAITKDVTSNSVEEQLGLQKNDVLVEMIVVRDNVETTLEINHKSDFSEQLLNLRVGDYLYYKVKRGGVVVDLKANKLQISSAMLDYPKPDKDLFSTYLN